MTNESIMGDSSVGRAADFDSVGRVFESLSPNQLAEVEIINQVRKKRGRLIAFYLICSYLYHKRGKSLVSDQFFNEIVLEIEESYDTIAEVKKQLIEDALLIPGEGLEGINVHYTQETMTGAVEFWNRFNPEDRIES